ncbi:hypothetical protein [Sphingopyxis sp. C-1]|uniref:hypothetical protein n=1 Tax=Sphingopyxis sp. C-1 TaxID=262667 RepID=UPI0007850A41|nr:hypothetical protein [Sphingopyxis sp. C-1]
MTEAANPPAFPNTGNTNWNLKPAEGMTLRDWFAGQVLAWPHNGELTPDDAAVCAYDYADAMIARRGAGK